MKPFEFTNSPQNDSLSAAYGWREIPDSLRHLPIVIMDVDGTLRGDVGPMTRLARPLVPRFLQKVMFREPWRLGSLIAFTWNLVRLWVMRTVNRDERRRYKHLFSELHHLAAAMMRFTDADSLRKIYRSHIADCDRLWYPAAVEVLRRITPHAVVVLVTGSEQLQTEECVRLLTGHGIDTSRIFVRGSLYHYDSETRRFTGRVRHLNVTFDSKRENVACFAHPQYHVAAAFGNSRPDRALFDVVNDAGACVLVCTASVAKKKRLRNFVLRKLRRSGFTICWSPEEVVAHEPQSEPQSIGGSVGRILVTDRDFRILLESDWLDTLFDQRKASSETGTSAVDTVPIRSRRTSVPSRDRTSSVPGMQLHVNESN